MTPLRERVTPVEERHLADGLRALRLTVMSFLTLDVLTTLLAPTYGITDLGPSGLLAATQMMFCVAAAAATMWCRVRAAIALGTVVAILSSAAGGTGEEPWLLVITGVVCAARADRRSLIPLAGGFVAYAALFGLSSEQRHPGDGVKISVLALGISMTGVVAGLIARRLLQTLDHRHERLRQLERENAQIRAVERGRLADDLQAVVTGGLAAIGEQGVIARRSGEVAGLREGLVRIDDLCRSLLTELRALLEVLRRDPAPGSRSPPTGTRPRRSAVGEPGHRASCPDGPLPRLHGARGAGGC